MMPVEERHDDALSSGGSPTVLKAEDSPYESSESVANYVTVDSLTADDNGVGSQEFASSTPSDQMQQAGDQSRQQNDEHNMEEDAAEQTKDGNPVIDTDEDKSTSTLVEEGSEQTDPKLNGHGDGDADAMQTLSDETDGWLDVIGSGDLMKKTIRKGDGINSRPARGDIVRLNVSGQLADGRHIEVEQAVEVTVGEAEVIQGLDLALPLIELNEIAEVVVKPRLAYGKLGKEPDVPPNATITYTIELLSVDDEPEAKGLAYPVRTHIGNRKRERGNFWFGRGEYSCALQCYRKALEFLDEESELATDLTHELKELLENRIKVYNNMAAAQLKIGAHDAALKSVDNVLKVQPKNVKALFRKGKILECMGQTSEAITILKEALQLEPEAKIIHHELSKLVEKQKVEVRTERELYKRMLGQDQQQQADHTNNSKGRSSSFGFIKWGFVAGGLTVALASVALYRHFHGI